MRSIKSLFLPTSRVVPVLALSTFALTGCGAGVVHLDPAPDASNPQCASAMVAMPTKIGDFKQRETTAQATTAWGDPAAVVLKCGVEVSQPVSDPCASVNGVDWIVKRTDAESSSSATPSAAASAASQKVQSATGTWTATTFGRSPNIQVTFDAGRVSSSSLLVELGSAVQQLPQTEKCKNIDDTLNVDQ